MPRAVDQATLAKALDAIERSGVTVLAASEVYGVGKSTLYREVARRKSNGSTKQALLAAIQYHSPREVPELQTALGIDRHNLVHLIYSLQKQGQVTFIERNGTPTHIEASQRPIRARGTDAAPVPVPEPSADAALDPLPAAAEWPELRRLRAQTRAIATATSALAGVSGLETVANLVADSLDLTTVEREYLRFAEEAL